MDPHGVTFLEKNSEFNDWIVSMKHNAMNNSYQYVDICMYIYSSYAY